MLFRSPLAAMGSIWIHYLTQTSMDRMGLVGAILLVGIVVNNGIVLVNYANQLRQSGMERTAAMLEASRVRFRPVFMTAMTTICGMIPLTFSSSNEMGVNYQSFGYTLIGGMTCGCNWKKRNKYFSNRSIGLCVWLCSRFGFDPS